MKNIEQVREELAQVFDDLKEGRINHHTASELNNCAGKIINSLKVQLDYYGLRKEKPTIDFMESNTIEKCNEQRRV